MNEVPGTGNLHHVSEDVLYAPIDTMNTHSINRGRGKGEGEAQRLSRLVEDVCSRAGP